MPATIPALLASLLFFPWSPFCQEGVTVEAAQPARPAQSGQTSPGAPPQDRRTSLLDEKRALQASIDRLMKLPQEEEEERSVITVNGSPVPREMVDREIVYLIGAQQIRQRIFNFLIDEYIEERIKEGADPERFKVPPEELEQHMLTTKKQWEQENPDKGSFEKFLEATNTSWEDYRSLAATSQVFDRLFFPGHPRNWPPIAQEAIIASGGDEGMNFWKRFRDTVDPIFKTDFKTTWEAVQAGAKEAGLTVATVQEGEKSGEISAQLPLDAEGTVASVTLTAEAHGGRDDRIRVRFTVADPHHVVHPVTEQALGTFVDSAAAAVAARLDLPPEDCYTGEYPPLWQQICRQWVFAKLTEWSEVRYASDGLPDDVVLLVNDRVWKTRDAARTLLEKARPEDFERALIEIVLRTALRQELEKEGHWLSDEEFRRAYDEYREPYDRTPFGVEVIATRFKGYPTLEAFKERWRLMRSFEDSIAQDINDDNLQAHLPRARNLLANAQVNVQFIRVPAFDDARGTWRPQGWERARKEADEVMAAIEAGMPFEEALARHGRYRMGDTTQGKLGFKNYNELRQSLGESEYLDFIHGYSIADILFTEVKEGQVVGPLRGSDGYVIAKLVARTPGAGAVDLNDPSTRDLVKQDYVSSRFLAWAGEVASRIKVE